MSAKKKTSEIPSKPLLEVMELVEAMNEKFGVSGRKGVTIKVVKKKKKAGKKSAKVSPAVSAVPPVRPPPPPKKKA